MFEPHCAYIYFFVVGECVCVPSTFILTAFTACKIHLPLSHFFFSFSIFHALCFSLPLSLPFHPIRYTKVFIRVKCAHLIRTLRIAVLILRYWYWIQVPRKLKVLDSRQVLDHSRSVGRASAITLLPITLK